MADDLKLDLDSAAFPVPSEDDLREAANTLWGKDVNAATADIIGSNMKVQKICTQLIEGWPAPAALTFAIVYGYMLRVEVERQARKVQLLT